MPSIFNAKQKITQKYIRSAPLHRRLVDDFSPLNARACISTIRWYKSRWCAKSALIVTELCVRLSVRPVRRSTGNRGGHYPAVCLIYEWIMNGRAAELGGGPKWKIGLNGASSAAEINDTASRS